MLYNPYIVVPFTTWFITQLAKFTIAALKGNIDFRYLYASGGMPSVHSAVVCSLATTAFLVDGMQSHLFGFTAIFAAVVMYDSFGVRRSSGEQAAAINMLIGSLDKGKIKIEQPALHLREILGHQPREVMAGAVVGVLLGGVFNYNHLTTMWNFLDTVPKRPESIIYIGIFGLLVILGIGQRFIWRSQYPGSTTIKRATNHVFIASISTALLGAISLGLIYENVGYFAWRFWPLAIIIVGLLWLGFILTGYLRTLPPTLVEELDRARKARWLETGKHRKSKRR